MKHTKTENVFQVFDILLMALILAMIVFPLMNIISVSVSSSDAIYNNRVTIYPVGFNTGAYAQILHQSTFIRSVINNVWLTIVGTFLSIIVTLLTAYALTKEFPGKKVVTYFFVITMYFSGGLIPTYVIYTNYLQLRNTYLVLILPYLVSMFYIIVMRSQIESMPASVFEAAYIDGANEYQTVFFVTLPMITPTIAAISMFFALDKWNMWFPVMVYTDTKDFWTLQYFLRVVVFDKLISNKSNMAEIQIGTQNNVPDENFRMAAIVLVAAPIVAIYPFVQKYFVKGIIAGAVKG